MPALGSDLLNQLRSAFKFAGMDQHMQELVAFALLEKLGTGDNEESGEEESPQKRARADSEGSFVSKFPELDYYTDTNLDCAICFEPYFKPVGLGCGHKFCRPCVERLVRATCPELGPSQVWAVLKRERDLQVACPCCRSRTSVGSKMPVLGSLCKRKFPKEFKSRAREVDKDFDRLFEMAWKEANAGCSAAACVVM